MSNVLLQNLQMHFKMTQFRRGQLEIIESVLSQQDTLAVLPTGGGKSLCYQLPAMVTKKLVIVVSPLIALMKDQVANLKSKGLAAGCLYSGQPLDEKRIIFSEIKKGGSYVLYLSPERVQKEGFKTWVVQQKISLFAIDEAHCISQWGHDFREEYSALKTLKELCPKIPVLALTASATPQVLHDITQQLQLSQPQKIVRGFYRENLFYQVEICEDEAEKYDWLIAGLKQIQDGRIIIYCGTRKTTEELHQALSKLFDHVAFYHAGLTQDQRTKIQTSYRDGKVRILLATNAFGMGIDQPNVRLVVHYNMPANIDSLYQEMGRAGRDGDAATCLLLFGYKDKRLQNYFIDQSEATEKIKDLRRKNLETLLSYCHSLRCRHSLILRYYQDTQRIRECGHCDTCNDKSTQAIKKNGFQNQLKPKVVLRKKSRKYKSK